MKLALARGALWMFGSMIFISVFSGSYFADKSFGLMVLILLFIGVLVGGAAFAYTWHEYEQQERELELAERRKALKNDSSKTT